MWSTQAVNTANPAGRSKPLGRPSPDGVGPLSEVERPRLEALGPQRDAQRDGRGVGDDEGDGGERKDGGKGWGWRGGVGLGFSVQVGVAVRRGGVVARVREWFALVVLMGCARPSACGSDSPVSEPRMGSPRHSARKHTAWRWFG
jgi:hypothetical protein